MIHQHELQDAPISIIGTGFTLHGTVRATVTVDVGGEPDPAAPVLSDWSCTPVPGPAGTTFTWRGRCTGPASPEVYLVLMQSNGVAGTEPRKWFRMASDYEDSYAITRELGVGTWHWQIEARAGDLASFTSWRVEPTVTQEQPPPPAEVTGPLAVSAADPRYFARPDGRRVFLAGSHTWDSIQDFRSSEATLRFDFAAFVRWLEGLGHNFTRLWHWDYEYLENSFLGGPQNVSPHPWPRPQTAGPRAKDGLWKFDLSQLNGDYLDRLDDRVGQLEAAGIYCSVMLFEGCVSSQFAGDPWQYHPFNPANNIQGLGSTAAAFYSLSDGNVLQVQQAYVQAVVMRLNGHRNLLWEISNETMGSSYAWQCQLVHFIRSVEASLPLQHPVGMTAMVRGGTDEQLIASPADWISPAMPNYQTPTFANSTGKVVLLDTDHLWGLGGSAEWVRQAAANGYNPIFMDPYLGNVVPETWNGGNPAQWAGARAALGDVQRQMNG